MKKLNIILKNVTASGDSLVDKLIDTKKLQKNLLDKNIYDEQTKELVRDIYMYFMEKFDLSQNERAAFNRLNSSLKSGSKLSGSMHRNIIFKAANILGMKLPSMMF